MSDGIGDAHTSPVAVDQPTWANIGGLSVWDYFAAAALHRYDFQTAVGAGGHAHVAQLAADIADAMCLERARRIRE